VSLRRSSRIWLAITPDAGVTSISGWTSAGTTRTSKGEWPLWTKVLAAGTQTIDLSQVLDANACYGYVSWYQDLTSTPPSWLLNAVRMHALGGGRKATGGLHVVENLDLEPVAAMDVHDDQYRLHLTSSSGWGDQLGKAVLGLEETSVAVVDTTTSTTETVVISKHWTLSDLRADLLDAGRVTVDAVSLLAQGKVPAAQTVLEKARPRFVRGSAVDEVFESHR